MARLHEYQGKAILAANGFKIPRGRAAFTAEEAVTIAKELELLLRKRQMSPEATPHACWK